MWIERAKCRDMGPDFFFPEGSLGGRYSLNDIRTQNLRNREHKEKQAAEFCKEGCSVIKECRDYAVRNNLDGVWGGTCYEERLTIRRKARVA